MIDRNELPFVTCPECEGSGYHIVAGCCGNFTKTGECCGVAVPDQMQCQRCSGSGLVYTEVKE